MSSNVFSCCGRDAINGSLTGESESEKGKSESLEPAADGFRVRPRPVDPGRFSEVLSTG